MAEQYRIEHPTSAAVVENGARKVVTVPSASIIDLQRPLNEVNGLIEVTFNGETVLMFAEDIRQRGKLLSRAQRARASSSV